MGNNVFFLNPPRLSNSFSIDIQDISNNLRTIDYKPFFRGINLFPMVFRKHFHMDLAKRIIETINEPIDITWSFDPSSFQYMRAFGAQLNIFHPVDVHRPKFERAISNYADIILATSDKILDRYKGINKPKFKINHGLADYFHLPQKNEVNFVKRPNRIKVGYVGNLNYRHLDTMVLKEIITLNPGVDFYFIGPYDKSNIGDGNFNSDFIVLLEELNNTYLIGDVESETLPAYLREFDLFLMCYNGDRHIAELANPHKILEFLVLGKL
tara:strand:- start:6 stop:809 length:804 start_codon:yes stop_codon:yes gene_type:complete